MNNLDFTLQINELALIRFIFLGLLLLVFFRLITRIAKRSDMRLSYRNFLRRTLPPVEGTVWFIFILISLNRLTTASFWSSVAIILLSLITLLWLSWYALRDIIAGIIIKAEGSLAVKDRIQLKEVTGQVKRMGYRIMEMETDNGETVNVPFSRVSGDLQIKSNPGERMKSHRFELHLTNNNTFTINETLKKIQTVGFNAPWSSLKKVPQVKLLEETDESNHFEIIIYALKVEYFSLIKNYLLTHLKDVKIK